MTYGERLAKAMEHGGFKTDKELAKALTAALATDGVRKADPEIPQQTIQSARTRIKGTSKYNSYIARLCRVSADWLQNEIGEMVTKSLPTSITHWPFESIDERRYLRLQPSEKRKIERLVAMMIEEFETDSDARPKKTRKKRK